MLEQTARHVVDGLRELGVDAHVAEINVNHFAIRIALGDGREAMWGSGDGHALDAEILRDGDLVGFIPAVEGSGLFDTDQIVDAIRRADYADPIGHERSTAGPPQPALPVEGGLFRRLMGGFRDEA